MIVKTWENENQNRQLNKLEKELVITTYSHRFPKSKFYQNHFLSLLFIGKSASMFVCQQGIRKTHLSFRWKNTGWVTFGVPWNCSWLNDPPQRINTLPVGVSKSLCMGTQSTSTPTTLPCLSWPCISYLSLCLLKPPCSCFKSWFQHYLLCQSFCYFPKVTGTEARGSITAINFHSFNKSFWCPPMCHIPHGAITIQRQNTQIHRTMPSDDANKLQLNVNSNDIDKHRSWWATATEIRLLRGRKEAKLRFKKEDKRRKVPRNEQSVCCGSSVREHEGVQNGHSLAWLNLDWWQDIAKEDIKKLEAF